MVQNHRSKARVDKLKKYRNKKAEKVPQRKWERYRKKMVQYHRSKTTVAILKNYRNKKAEKAPQQNWGRCRKKMVLSGL